MKRHIFRFLNGLLLLIFLLTSGCRHDLTSLVNGKSDLPIPDSTLLRP